MDAIALRQVGCQLALQKSFTQAKKCFHKAIEIDPDFAQAHFDLAYLYLLLGDYKQGFREFEWRLRIDDDLNRLYQAIYDPGKQWLGQNLEGKRILVYTEQGIGDGLHFLRYLRYLKAKEAHIILHVHKPTIPLLEGHPWIDEMIAADITEIPSFPEYDYQCSIMSLPWLLQQFSISGQPYILPPSPSREFPPHSVGIVWAGTRSHVNDVNRSIPLEYFKSLDAHLYGMQVEPRPDVTTSLDYTDLSPEIHDLKDTAAFLEGLDLLICCDTAVAHLAGAIGTPCWLLLPYIPDWRWGLNNETTPWYNSVRIFRQSRPGNWIDVFKLVSEELNKVCNGYISLET